MSETRRLILEALNPINKIANSIIKKLNYIETSLILDTKTFEEAEKFLQKTAAYHSNAFEELSSENQQQVLQKLWSNVHKVLGQTPVEESDNEEQLEQKIYAFLKQNSGILYPLELSAKKLAKALSNKE